MVCGKGAFGCPDPLQYICSQNLQILQPGMNNFTISDIENLTRIKAHTLRIWEQRYNLLVPKRTETGHRYYDGEDLKSILRVAWLYHHDYKISRISKMSLEEIREKALGLDNNSIGPEQLLNRLLESSIDFNEQEFMQTLDQSIAQQGFQSTMLQIIFPFLKKLGLFWLTGHVIPSQEHFASALIIRKLLYETDQLPQQLNTGKRKVVLFTPVGEHHEIPLLFVRYLMKKTGIRMAYLGANIPVETLKDYCIKKKQVTEIYFHLITNLTRTDLTVYLEQLHREIPEVGIYFSGIRPDITSRLPDGVYYLDSQEAILNYTR